MAEVSTTGENILAILVIINNISNNILAKALQREVYRVPFQLFILEYVASEH